MTLRDQMKLEASLNYIAHHGILGQKWGVRRFQNKDGTLTAEGKAHIGKNKETAKKFVSDNSVSMITNRRKYESEYDSTDEGKKRLDKIGALADKAADAYDSGDGDLGDKYMNEVDKLTDDYDVEVGKYASKRMIEAYGDTVAKIESDTYKKVEKYVDDLLENNDPDLVDEMMQNRDLYKEMLR